MRSGLCPPVGFASGVTCPARKYWRTASGSVAVAMCAMTKRKHVNVTSQCTKVIPVCDAHSQRAWFAQVWHALQCVRCVIGDIEDEDVCYLVAQWSGRVRVRGVEALDILDYFPGNWDWWGVPCRC